MMVSKSFLLSILCLTAVTADVVQVVTPEVVEVVTSSSPESSAYKRETPSNGTEDSYLMALKESQGQVSRFDPPETKYDQPEPSYGPGPIYDYHQPESNYGPPKGYQPSKPSYHKVQPPSKPSIPYGPPAPMYLPSQGVAPQPPAPFYGIPFAASQNAITSMFQNLMPKGIDLETVFKLLLKLTLFKIIVKFIAVICLLLAYPIFQSKEKEEMMEEEDDKKRQFEALNDLTAMVWNSIYPPKFVNGTAVEENDENIVEKVAGEINDKMTVPSEEAAIGFLEFCVAAANTAVGWMMSFVKRRNNEVDPLQQFLWSLWERIKQSLIQSLRMPH